MPSSGELVALQDKDNSLESKLNTKLKKYRIKQWIYLLPIGVVRNGIIRICTLLLILKQLARQEPVVSRPILTLIVFSWDSKLKIFV